MKKLLLVLLTLIICGTTGAKTRPEFPYTQMAQTADEYFSAYSRLDTKAMSMHYADDIRYIDETLAGYDGSVFDLTSRDKVIAYFEDSVFPYSKKFDWQEEERFFSGNQAVFKGRLVVDFKGTVAGKPEDTTYIWRVNYMVVLTFENGKIARQNDYLNYPASTFTQQK